MDEVKLIKDPLYDYIEIPKKYCKKIIDTSVFQRLRRIIQTSYSPLYASSLHNRFTHSLGVFHLGTLASEAIKKNVSYDMLEKIRNSIDIDKTIETFLLACLLHDVGHAPFSHTGERFYLKNESDYTLIHEKLKELIKLESFSKDIPVNNLKSAAPHEIMSAIVGIEMFGEYIDDFEFFSRCITGYQYSTKDEKSSLYNCFISLINSKVIDVDRLDYLIRDAFFTGFDSVSIDYKRLLNSLTIIYNNNNYEIAYQKNAISIIENVVYAHDSERKWIQNHPVVLYDIYIIQNVISKLNEKYIKNSKLFSREALSVEGLTFDDNTEISLFCDDDIIHLLKNKLKEDKLSLEYFDRSIRRKPIWKSESEYKTYLHTRVGEGKILKDIEDALIKTVKYVNLMQNGGVIDQLVIDELSAELDELQNSSSDFVGNTTNTQIQDKKCIKKVLDILYNHSQKIGQECNYVILKASQFNSNFNKLDVKNINVIFGNEIRRFEDVVSTLSGTKIITDNFFYIYYRDLDIEIDKKELFGDLIKAFT